MTTKSHKHSLKAAVYDRWLATLGGGEQVAFAYAEALRDLGYETDFLTHRTIDLDKATQKLDINPKGINFVSLPDKSSQEMSEYTEKYDVFVNTSYLDYFPNRSKFGILSIFFPNQIYLTPWEFLKRTLVVPSFRRFFIYPSYFEGFRYDEYKHSIIYKWLSHKSDIIFAKDIRKLNIHIYFENAAISTIDSTRFTINDQPLKPTEIEMNHQTNVVLYHFDLPAGDSKTFSILAPEGNDYFFPAALTRVTIPNWRFALYNLFKRLFPRWEMRLHGGPGVTKLADLESYHSIVTISNFCQDWIKKFWGLPSVVMYPPVNVEKFKPAKRKKNWIMHVGRFFVSGHSKKQLDMIKVFKKLVAEHKVDDWELHFIGSIHPGGPHADYFQQCQQEAEGFPVFFHTDIAFDELKELLGQAKIYWHATGLDADEKNNPSVFEHFGITTIEAMASGCVPIVIHGGGQKEIVTPEAGFTWHDRREWAEQTLRVIQDPQLWKKLEAGALARATTFDRKMFKKRFSEFLDAR